MIEFKASSPLVPKKLEGIPEGLPPEEVERLQKLQMKLTEFVLHLIQAFLRTGYYTPEHPESKKAKEGLYGQFKILFEEGDELAFLVREEQEWQEIFVEGVLPEAQRLSRMMMKGMGELYVPKFVKYMERKDLISLTLKSRMSQTEFTRFIDIMSEPSLVDTHRKQDKERFTQTLLKNGVFNISYVFNEELLAPDREMPWRARITLSRMRKDLKMIPYFQKMTGQELHEVRRILLSDALRPIKQSDLFCAILRNSDLAATPENREEVIEDVILSFLQRQYLWGTSKVFLREHLALKQQKRGDAFEAKSDRLVSKISKRLRESDTKETETLLEEYFRHQLIGLDDLPPRLKDKILLERLTDKFLDYTDQFFQQLDQAKEKERYLAVAHSFVRMIPELIRRDRYSEIERILKTLKRHFYMKRMWALLAGQVLEEIGKGDIPLLLEEKFLSAKKEIRSAIIPVFVSLGIGAIPYLLRILNRSEDQWVRKNACEALIQVGPVAAIHLINELNVGKASVETTIDILRVLGQIKSEQWKTPLLEVLRKYVAHENPKLKEQALHTLCQIGGVEGEGIFLSNLNESSLEVQRKAVWCLGMIKSEKGAEKMLGLLHQISTHPSPQTLALETQIYHAFGLIGNLTIAGKTLEETLLEILEKRGLKRWFGFLQRNPLSENALRAICDSLGKIGTKKSVKVLSQLEKSFEGPLALILKDTIKKIKDRD